MGYLMFHAHASRSIGDSAPSYLISLQVAVPLNPARLVCYRKPQHGCLRLILSCICPAGAYGSRHMGYMGGPAPARHTYTRWVAEIRNPSSCEHLWTAAVRSAYTTASSADVHPIMSQGLSHLVEDQCIDCRVTAVVAACSLCHDHDFPSCPDFGSAPRAQAAREHRWRHIEHLLFECQCIPSWDSSVALALLQDDLFRVCSGSDHAEAVLLEAFPTSRTPFVAASDCAVPFLLDAAAALGRMSLGT